MSLEDVGRAQREGGEEDGREHERIPPAAAQEPRRERAEREGRPGRGNYGQAAARLLVREYEIRRRPEHDGEGEGRRRRESDVQSGAGFARARIHAPGLLSAGGQFFCKAARARLDINL